MSDPEDAESLDAPIPVRFSQETIDAIEEIAHDARTNRCEVIREMVRDCLGGDGWELSTDAAILANFNREKRYSKVTYYREGWQNQVRRVLGGLAYTSPIWPPEGAEGMIPRWEDQLEELYPNESQADERQEKLEETKREVERYRIGYEIVVEDRDPESIDTPEWLDCPPEESYFVPKIREAIGYKEPEDPEDAEDVESKIDELAREVPQLLEDQRGSSRGEATPEHVEQVLADRPDVTEAEAAKAVDMAIQPGAEVSADD